MLPTDVQETWLEVDAMRIHCLSAGSSGSPVILLHGGGIDSASLSWDDAIGPLSAHHRVFAPDLPGYGLSDTPDIQYTTDFYATFVKLLLDVLHLDKVSLVGLSMGGAIALSFTLRFPDHVDKLVLVDPYGIIDANMWPRWIYLLLYIYVHYLSFANELAYQYMGASRDRVRRQLVASGVVHSTKRLSPQLIDQVYQHAHLKGRGKAFTSYQQSEFLWHGLRTNLIDRLREITVPTLIINGEKDRGVPLAYAQKAHELIAGSHLYVLKDCGHWPQREMPEEFNRVVGDFLVISGGNDKQ
jgi:pimeloyl-ACP methyl ester carboxylesterase